MQALVSWVRELGSEITPEECSSVFSVNLLWECGMLQPLERTFN